MQKSSKNIGVKLAKLLGVKRIFGVDLLVDPQTLPAVPEAFQEDPFYVVGEPQGYLL